jgi:hypothetical protein
MNVAVLTARVLEADAVLPRIIPNGSLEQIIYRVDALHWMETRGVRIMNGAGATWREAGGVPCQAPAIVATL